jgi:indolepyruvate ferredoxin oxidoreductase, beta subunit
METNIILAGVGGQGILSISYVIDMTSLKQGLSFKQSEVHGMSQRGGSVISHLRVADHTIYSDLVPKGRGTIVLSVEPLESLRYVEFLSPEGAVVSGVDPYVNIADYPDVDRVLDGVGSLHHHTLVNTERLARQAGSGRAQNMVLLGAASPFLGLRDNLLEESIREAFARKGDKVQRVNVDAFRMGKAAGAAYRACRAAGIGGRETRALVGRLDGGALQEAAVPLWKELFASQRGAAVAAALVEKDGGRVAGTPDVPRAILAAPQDDAARLAQLLFIKAS